MNWSFEFLSTVNLTFPVTLMMKNESKSTKEQKRENLYNNLNLLVCLSVWVFVTDKRQYD